MNNLLKHCVSIDVETTGIDPVKNAILSIGAANFINNETFYCDLFLRNQEVEIDPYALKVNGELEEEIRKRSSFRSDKPYFSEIEALQNLISFGKKTNSFVIIGKNPNFDRNFLLEIWKRNNLLERDFPFTYRVINWADMAIPLILKDNVEIPSNGFSSNMISEFLKVGKEETPHNALNGALHNKKCINKVLELHNL